MTTTAEATRPAVPARSRAEALRRADGIELLGKFEDSGFRDAPRLVRRADGQVVQLTELLYAVVEATDGRRDADAIAAIVSWRFGRQVSGGNILYLAERRLRPLGVLALADGTTPALEKREPLMALRHRRPLLSERAVNAGARLFTWLHLPPIKLVLLLGVAAFDVWLFGFHGIAGGLRSAIYNPTLLLAVFASVIVATAFHEFGHASACRYSGARPGVMGVGLYLVWPAFYCDVTDAYRLNRRGRLRTDLGGVYFNLIFVLLSGGVFLATGEEAALLAAAVQHILILQQLLPLLRFDGYYVLTDLTGVPDILSRIRPIFSSLIPGREKDPRVAELKPWVRATVTGYLLVLIPTLLFLLVWMTIGFPRLLATVHDSFGLQLDRIRDAGDPANMALGAIRIVTLALPVLAISLSVTRVSQALGRGLYRWSDGSIPRRAVATLVMGALIGSVAYTWWPNGDYEPIRPGEGGTIGEVLAALPELPGGRPGFTPAREQIFEPVPTVRQIEAARREGRPLAVPGGPDGPEVTVPGTPPAFGYGDDFDDLADHWSQPSEDPFPYPSSSGSAGDWQTYPSQSTQQPSTTSEPAPSGTTSEPAPTTTQPAPTTTTEPTPTTTEPTPTTTTEPTPTTTTEPTPTTTEPTPTTTTEPEPTTTETTPMTTETTPTTTEPSPTTVPDTTTTTP